MKNMILFLLGMLLAAGCDEGSKNNNIENAKMNSSETILNKFVPTEINYNEALLSEREKVVIEKLYLASKIIDEIFLKQVYIKNQEIKKILENDSSAEGITDYNLFKVMFGPFNRLDNDKPFWGKYPKPPGANFYPPDMTKEEFESWIKNNPQDEKSFTSEFTVIRRDSAGLVAIPYSEYFNEELSKISALLKEAAKYSDNKSLEKFLVSRADAFLSNDYFQSDMDWMDLKDHNIEVVIGPYEVYEDKLFNYKASFESFVTIKDPVETKKLEIFSKYLKAMEKNLPIPDMHKNYNRGSESPIVVVNEIFTAGDTKAGVQTLAFNLPNDERVRKVKGSKKVMLKNVHEAKYEKLLVPIAKEVLDASQLKYLSFEAFFNHTLMHEMSHGIGPGFIKVNGKETEVKKELKETYSTIEECKADILGMYNNIFMIDQKIYPEEIRNQLWVTFLAGIFRSIRFGIEEAHGGGNAIIFNYLLEKGAYSYDKANGKVKVNFEKIYPALKQLAETVLTIQAEGNYKKAKELINSYAVESGSISALRKKLFHLPVDIKPVFEIEKKRAN